MEKIIILYFAEFFFGVKNMENEVILYTDENGKTNVSVRFANEEVWVTQAQLAEIYNTTQQNISLHIDNIFYLH